MADLDMGVVGKRTDPVVFDYTWKDVVLYALGVGATTEELSFIYEHCPGGLKVLPSFCVVPAFLAYPSLGGKIDRSRLLHGEQEIRLYEPISPTGRLISVGEVTGVFDKGTGAAFHITVTGRREGGELVFEAKWVTFYLGGGGFGGDPGPQAEKWDPPEGVSPDYRVSERIAENQAALYRLNGDVHPLHVDPDYARKSGFNRPILHGLCTYGFAVRAVVNKFLEGDVARFRRFRARFSRPVHMGDTLTTACWRVGEGIIVQVETENGVVIKNAKVEID